MSSGIRAKPDNILRLLAVCGVIAPISFTVIVTILGFLRPSYSHVSQTISELGSPGAPNVIVQDANFVVTGLLITAFAFGLRRGVPAAKSSKGSGLIGALGAAIVLDGFFPISVAGSATTIVDAIHDVAAVAGFIAFIIAAFVFSRRLRKDSLWRGYGTYSRVTAVLAIIFLVGFFLGGPAQSNFGGVVQRLLVGVLLLWIEVMAIHLLKLSNQLQVRTV